MKNTAEFKLNINSRLLKNLPPSMAQAQADALLTLAPLDLAKELDLAAATHRWEAWAKTLAVFSGLITSTYDHTQQHAELETPEEEEFILTMAKLASFHSTVTSWVNTLQRCQEDREFFTLAAAISQSLDEIQEKVEVLKADPFPNQFTAEAADIYHAFKPLRATMSTDCHGTPYLFLALCNYLNTASGYADFARTIFDLCTPHTDEETH